MGLSIKNDETERLVRELARRKGIGVTKAIRLAVSNELDKTSLPNRDPVKIREAIRRIQENVATLPIFDRRTPDEILGYDEYGLPS